MYPGGKGSTFRVLINQMPPHRRYFELFLGDGAVMRNKRPAGYNLGMDIDPEPVATVRADLCFSHAKNGDISGSFSFVVGDAIPLLQAGQFGPGDFLNLDPPYLMETRRQKRPLYNCEFGQAEDHETFLAAVLALPPGPMVMICGYWSQLYETRLRGWRRVDYPAQTRSGATAVESIWMNYPEPVRLHDYSFLGDNFRERERIGRKAKRWVAGLQRLPILEQKAILAQMKENGLID